MDRRWTERTVEDGVGKRVVQILSWTQETRNQQDNHGNPRLEKQSAAIITRTT